jgi:hypothetical protein
MLNKPIIPVRILAGLNPYAECEGVLEMEATEEDPLLAIRGSLSNERNASNQPAGISW